MKVKGYRLHTIMNKNCEIMSWVFQWFTHRHRRWRIECHYIGNKIVTHEHVKNWIPIEITVKSYLKREREREWEWVSDSTNAIHILDVFNIDVTFLFKILLAIKRKLNRTKICWTENCSKMFHQYSFEVSPFAANKQLFNWL